jgi:hypothetical protein
MQATTYGGRPYHYLYAMIASRELFSGWLVKYDILTGGKLKVQEGDMRK